MLIEVELKGNLHINQCHISVTLNGNDANDICVTVCSPVPLVVAALVSLSKGVQAAVQLDAAVFPLTKGRGTEESATVSTSSPFEAK